MDATAPLDRTDPSGRDLNVPAIAAALAATISLVIAVIGWTIEHDGGAVLGLAGLPVVTVLAARWADRTVSTDRIGAAGAAVALAIATVAVADLIVVALSFLGAGLAALAELAGISFLDWPLAIFKGVATGIAFAIVLWGAGMLIVGIPVLFVTVPAALLWAALLRLAIRAGRR